MKKKTNVKKKSLPIRVPSRKKKLTLKSKRKPKKSLAIRRPISVGKKIKTKKVPTKRATYSIRKKVGSKAKSRVVSKVKSKPISKYRIVRIMGQGQFTVDNTTLKRLNEIDDSIVQLVSTERSDDIEFRKRLTELTSIVESNGQPLDPKEIIQSDIILPSTDLSIDEAKRLFKGEGVIPET
ncbi:MAG TPA: hypothetical protein VLR10_01710 [Nitrososphaeraceae archaeon]|nr:hypothetical protein [Nitrososphaeraceae archaeon]